MTEWRALRLRRVFENAIGGTWGREPGEADFDVACVRGTDFDMTTLSIDETRLPVRSITRAEWALRGLRRGDIVIEKSGGGEQQPVGRAVQFDLNRAAVPTNFAARLRPASGHDPSFLTYLLNSCYASGTTKTAIKQTTGIQNLDLDSFLSTQVVVPTEKGQQTIAESLDAETARIDALIARKRLMMRLIGERWMAARRRAVTHGVDSGVVFRRTDLPWLEEVPAHWRTSKLAHLGEIQSGMTPSTDREDYWDGDVPWVSPKDMKQFELPSTQVQVTSKAVMETGLRIVEPGSVLFVARGMILAHTFPVALTGVAVTINQDMKALSAHRDDARFLAHLLAGVSDSVLSLLVEESAHGTRVLRMERWKDFPLFLPPLDEQRMITRHLDGEMTRVEQTTTRIKRQIDLLLEHRQALITAAVTGQLDIAKAAA